MRPMVFSNVHLLNNGCAKAKPGWSSYKRVAGVSKLWTRVKVFCCETHLVFNWCSEQKNAICLKPKHHKLFTFGRKRFRTVTETVFHWCPIPKRLFLVFMYCWYTYRCHIGHCKMPSEVLLFQNHGGRLWVDQRHGILLSLATESTPFKSDRCSLGYRIWLYFFLSWIFL